MPTDQIGPFELLLRFATLRRVKYWKVHRNSRDFTHLCAILAGVPLAVFFIYLVVAASIIQGYLEILLIFVMMVMISLFLLLVAGLGMLAGAWGCLALKLEASQKHSALWLVPLASGWVVPLIPANAAGMAVRLAGAGLAALFVVRCYWEERERLGGWAAPEMRVGRLVVREWSVGGFLGLCFILGAMFFYFVFFMFLI